MVVLLDSASIQVPQLQEDGVWLTTFRQNADLLFEREKPWIRHGRKNLSTVVKELYLYLNQRSAKKGFNYVTGSKAVLAKQPATREPYHQPVEKSVTI